MAMSSRTYSLLADALADKASASELKSLLSAATGGVGTDPSVNTVTTTSTITSGGDIKIASGHTLKVNNITVVSAQQTAVTPVAVTFTANAPATYASPTGALTVADGSVPTVVELVKYCNELRGNIVALQAVLHAHGLTT